MGDEKKPGIPLGARLKNLFVGGLIGLAIGGGWAGYVWWTGGQALTEAQSAHQADLDAAKAAAESLNAELDKERAKVAHLGALADVSRALQALDQQNYGLVTNHLKQAAQRLEGLAGAEAVAGKLGMVTVDPATPGVARDTIVGLSGELEALHPDQ